MPEVVSFNEEKKLIEVHAFGTLSLSEWLEDLKEIERLHHQESCPSVLVDITELVSGPGTPAIFETVTEKLSRDMRYALVMEAGQAISKDVRFLGNVSQNRGVQLRLFNRRQGALKWLDLD